MEKRLDIAALRADPASVDANFDLAIYSYP